MAGTRRTAREDGQAYASQTADYDPGFCRYCGNKLVAYTEGRPPKYCGPTCRSGAYRRAKPTRKVRENRSAGQTL